MFNFNNIFSRHKWQSEIVPFPTQLKNIKMVRIIHLQSRTQANFTQKDIVEFLHFMQNGSYYKALKGATRYHIQIEHEEGVCDYFINGDTIAPESGGLVQAIFEPRKRGFEVFLHSFF